MPLGVNPAEAVFEDGDFETGLKKVFSRVADTVFGCNTHNINYLCTKQLQHFRQTLAGGIAAFESGILLHRRIASFKEREFFLHEGLEVVVDLAAAGAGHAMRGPGAALLHERGVVCGMMVADEKDRHLPFVALYQGFGGGNRFF